MVDDPVPNKNPSENDFRFGNLEEFIIFNIKSYGLVVVSCSIYININNIQMLINYFIYSNKIIKIQVILVCLWIVN